MKHKTTIPVFCLLAVLSTMGLAGCDWLTRKGVPEWKNEGNAKKLIASLDSPDRRIRITAAQALGELKAEQAVDPLALQLASPDAQLAVAAVEALASIDNGPAETHLIAALELKDPRVRTSAINSLGKLKSLHAIDPLAKTLKTGEPQVATAAAVALGRINDEKAIETLAVKIDSPSYSLRAACVESISGIGGQEAVKILAGLIGDPDDNIRKIAIDTLIANKTVAAPYALKALHSKNRQTWKSAATILQNIDAVPTEGEDYVFYLITQIPPLSKGIDEALVLQLAESGNEAIGILLKAIAHKSPSIREYAFRALETIGEPCAEQAARAVETHATPDGKLWFSKRTSWEGAPSWRLDLWGAATALNPRFKPPRIKKKKRLTEGYAVQVLSATRSRTPREYIPQLISLLTPFIESSNHETEESGSASLFGSASRKKNTLLDFRETAEKRLVSAGKTAIFPLIVATDSDSKRIADASRKLLDEIERSSDRK